MIHAPERVEAIRANVAAKLKVVSELEELIQDAYFHEQLKLIRHWLGDIETFFLRDLSRQSRSPDAEAHWLDWAEAFLDITAQQIKSIQDLIARYGSNLRAAG